MKVFIGNVLTPAVSPDGVYDGKISGCSVVWSVASDNQTQLWDFSISEGGHYSKPVPVMPHAGMEALRTMFPDGVANEMNFVLFSTSGIHGSYATIEDHEAEPIYHKDGEKPHDNEITFLIVHPRIVAMRYGKVCPRTEEDYAFLKKLRQTSWDAVLKIGKHKDEENQ